MDKEILLQSILLIILNSCPFEEQSIVFTVNKIRRGRNVVMKKAFSVLGMASGIAVVVLGFLMLFGVLRGNASSATSSSYLYPSG